MYVLNVVLISDVTACDKCRGGGGGGDGIDVLILSDLADCCKNDGMGATGHSKCISRLGDITGIERY